MRINFNSGRPPSGPLGKVAAAIVGVLAIAAGLMFSLVFVVVIAVVGIVVWAYFWWKTRDLRRRLREQSAQAPFGQPGEAAPGESDVIEGEAVRVVDEDKRLNP